MKKYGLIGYPLGHSFSKEFFNQKFEAEHISATYQNFEIKNAEEMLQIIANEPKLVGLNVTIPHKEQVIPLLDELSEEAAAIGAVNVIQVIRQKEKIRLIGHNSDVVGFYNSIEPLLKDHHQKALILGTGGASKAVLYGLKKLGFSCTFVSRTSKEGALTYAELTPELIKEYTVIVNCTPVGMYPKTEECPQIPYEALTSDHLLYDLLYNPDITLFMKKGAKQGATVKNGLEMLLLQAFDAWNIWESKNSGMKGIHE
ncbi:MAG: shikimate dehydrogenase family protein [Phocaeicola sp.]